MVKKCKFLEVIKNKQVNMSVIWKSIVTSPHCLYCNVNTPFPLRKEIYKEPYSVTLGYLLFLKKNIYLRE